jgi:penicillin-binding protein 1C
MKKFFTNRRVMKAFVYWGVLLGLGSYLFWGTPLPTRLSSNEQPVSTKIFDRNEKLIYEIYTDQKRTPIKLGEIPDAVKKATIAIEDKDFYKHRGFSVTGIARAVFNNIFKNERQGGSTISQQLVKNALLTQEKTIRRKVQELVLTTIVEGIYTKDQILEMYLNTIPYGGTAYGIEAASETYFGKPTKDLNLAEAALLAGLPQRPSSYSPFGAHPELAKIRQREVLKQMVINKFISQDEADKAVEEELKYAKINPPQAPHFALWIKEQLADKYGDKIVEQGGLRVYTTLDLDLQNFAQQAVATEVGKLKKQKVGNGAVIVTKPSTGEILAMVGSKDYFAIDEDGKVNVTLASRQPGSSIKPLNYALALRDKKITAATAIADVPICFKVSGQQDYCPVNYDNTFHGLVEARFALGNSYNIPAVKVLALNGVENFINFANKMGITTFTDPAGYGLSLTLGGGNVRPIDMAQAFGVFANQGIVQPLVAVTKVMDWKGNTLESYDIAKNELSGERVLDPSVTFLISHILLDNNARNTAFGDHSFLNVSGHPEVSVKTGTTNDRRDNWTDGYTADAVVVTWVGNNDNTPMSGAVSGVSGASPIWNRVMKFVLDRSEKGIYDPKKEDATTVKRSHAWPNQPDGVIGATICADTGSAPGADPANPGCPTRFEYFLSGTVPTTSLVVNQDVFINNATGQIAASTDPPEQIHVENRPVFTDPDGTLYCLTCPVASASAVIRYPLPQTTIPTPNP